MSISSTIAATVILVAILWAVMFGDRLPRPYRERQCHGRDWKSEFPGATKEEIREFLALFSQAFGLADREMLKLKPDDEVLAIYRATYPIQGMPDALELETFALGLQIRYGLSLEDMWTDGLTLGELFAKTTSLERQAT